MIPPKGFKNEIYPLRHNLVYSAGLSVETAAMNSCFFTLVRSTADVIAGTPQSIVVNPHNSLYVSDGGPAVCKMSIIDKLNLSLSFNMTELTDDGELSSSFWGDGIKHLYLTWRPIFFSFKEKLEAADDDTNTTVATILGLTHASAQEDVVPLTTSKLPVGGKSDLSQPLSTVNIAESATLDYNMSTDATMEDHPWDEALFQDALRRYTNKGALKACVGRTRHVNLTRAKPFKRFYISKFVPRAIRRVMPFTFMGIQINVPLVSDGSQDYMYSDLTASVAHIGVKARCTFHEWNADHWQGMTGAAPAP